MLFIEPVYGDVASGRANDQVGRFVGSISSEMLVDDACQAGWWAKE